MTLQKRIEQEKECEFLKSCSVQIVASYCGDSNTKGSPDKLSKFAIEQSKSLLKHLKKEEIWK